MSTKYYDIKFGTAADWAAEGEKKYSPGFQTEAKYIDSWKSVLQKAHAVKEDAINRKVIQCRCNGSSTKRDHCLLEVRELDGTYFLAKKKHTGPQHKDDCRFFQIERESSGLRAYDEGIVANDGSIKVGLGLQMSDKEGHIKAPAPSTLPPRRHNGAKRREVSLLGLLQILWSAAGLNYCKSESINQRDNIAFRLFKQAEAIKIKQQNLEKHLLMYDMAKANRETLAFATKNKRRLFVIAPLKPWVSVAESESGVLPIQLSDGIPELNLIDGIWDSTAERSYKRVVLAWRKGQRVMAIAQIEPREDAKAHSGYACQVVGLALMRTTSYWLPVESDYEQTIADELVKVGRRFIKPLRYDADETDVFPDFILLDTADSRGTPMEVFGMTSTEYRERQAEKAAYYNEAFGLDGWWCWVTSERREYPPFPPAV